MRKVGAPSLPALGRRSTPSAYSGGLSNATQKIQLCSAAGASCEHRAHGWSVQACKEDSLSLDHSILFHLGYSLLCSDADGLLCVHMVKLECKNRATSILCRRPVESLLSRSNMQQGSRVCRWRLTRRVALEKRRSRRPKRNLSSCSHYRPLDGIKIFDRRVVVLVWN